MAIDDVINDTVQIAGSGNFVFQPAADVEIMITWVAGQASDIDFALFDGTNIASYLIDGAVSTNTNRFANIKMGITNTNHLRAGNSNVSARQFAFTGLQIK